MSPVGDAHDVLADALASRVFPSAVAEAGDSQRALWRQALGTLTFDVATPVDPETPYDLASLTKVIATATIVMRHVEQARLGLEDTIARFVPEWRGADREGANIRDLLEHASGLPARLVDPPPATRREFEHEICTMPLEYPVRTRSVYSDLGFILLGFVAADCGRRSLASQFAALWPDPGLTFELSPTRKRRAAPTLPLADDTRRGRMLVGEVHDAYAAALGGAAGHAGLFGTAAAVGAFARTVLAARRADPEHAARHAGESKHPAPLSIATAAVLTARSTVPHSSRALGWDTMLPTSSCGSRLSEAAFGHVGFTGTSLWIDPVRNRYFVLLTNRACGGGTVDEMREVRRAFHDALGDV